MSAKALKLYFVVGEESGDILGSGLLDTFAKKGVQVEPVGLGGTRMQERGLSSLFDIADISVMGFSGVIIQLPRLLKRIRQTVADVLDKKPDVLVLIDSPDFSYRVAKAVRKKNSSIKIIKYVAPSVWAWRPGRASKIKPYIDHILAVLPFEPKIMKDLDGPDCTYVGHPLASHIPDIDRSIRETISPIPKLVVLPGSRRSEITRLLPVIGQTLDVLKSRGNVLSIVLPAVPRLEEEIRKSAETWAYPVNIVTGDAARKAAFTEADLALSASGTVTLELATYKLPTIAIYKLDAIASVVLRRLVIGWAASLPNLIADYPVIPERFNEYVKPGYIARLIEQLLVNGPARQTQLDGFDIVIQRLRQETPSQERAADKIIEVTNYRLSIET
jgi:lipid-A-disaccharide synthase